MFLVTTALEPSWDTSRPVVFLGEWCRRFSRQDVWHPLDAKVLPYHWADRGKYNADYSRLEGLYERYLGQLSGVLGHIHGVTEDVHYWRIVIGPWLRFFIDAIFDRFETVRTAREIGHVADSWVLPYRLEDWTPLGFGDFYASFTDDPWNHIVFAECARALGIPCSNQPDGLAPLRPEKPAIPSRRRGKRLLLNLAEKCGRYIPSALNRYVVVASYLPLQRLVRLQLSLGQLPYLVSPNVAASDVPLDLRVRASLACGNRDTVFDTLLNDLVAKWMPKTYVEDFSSFRKKSLAAFPAKPRLVFTANAYQGDDAFKLWAAEQTLRQVPLVIGQHGGNLGIAHHNQTEDHQFLIADAFCSWGWRHTKYGNTVPLPSLQLSDNVIASDPEGDVLIVLASLPRYFYCHFSMPMAGEFLTYLEDQMAFVRKIRNSSIRERIRIRLNGDGFGWDIAERFTAAGMGWAIDANQEHLDVRLARARLCIASYNATVILQTLASNFPTLAYWNPAVFDIRPEAVPAASLLREVGILHDSYDSAAQTLNAVHDNIAAWWYAPRLQAARVKFCRTYAHTSPGWTKQWAQCFDDMAKRAHV